MTNSSNYSVTTHQQVISSSAFFCSAVTPTSRKNSILRRARDVVKVE